jgi:hypothetical protein
MAMLEIVGEQRKVPGAVDTCSSAYDVVECEEEKPKKNQFSNFLSTWSFVF